MEVLAVFQVEWKPLAVPQLKHMAKKLVLPLVFMLLLVIPGRTENGPEAGESEFVFARLRYGGGGGGFRFGGSWATDAPASDHKFMYGIKRLSNVNVSQEFSPVGIMDPTLFDYPYVYIVEPGSLYFSETEAQRMREYFDRGGFLHMDDFWGLYEKQNAFDQMRKVFPDRKIEELPITHEIFHTFFDLKEVMQIPNVRNGCYGGRHWEVRDDILPRIYGIKDMHDRIVAVITYNSDLGDAWEWMDEPCYPEMLTAQSYRMGLNFIIYAMSH
jgi:Domain of unknown function (DUF4159)